MCSVHCAHAHASWGGGRVRLHTLQLHPMVQIKGRGSAVPARSPASAVSAHHWDCVWRSDSHIGWSARPLPAHFPCSPLPESLSVHSQMATAMRMSSRMGLRTSAVKSTRIVAAPRPVLVRGDLAAADLFKLSLGLIQRILLLRSRSALCSSALRPSRPPLRWTLRRS